MSLALIWAASVVALVAVYLDYDRKAIPDGNR